MEQTNSSNYIERKLLHRLRSHLLQTILEENAKPFELSNKEAAVVAAALEELETSRRVIEVANRHLT